MTRNKLSRRRLLRGVGAGAATTAIVGPASASGYDEFIIGLEAGESPQDVKSAARSVHRELDFGEVGQAISGQFSQEAIQAFERNPAVRYVEKNGRMEALGDVVPYGIEITDADLAIDAGHTGGEVSIAILDTGIDVHHETLAENLGDGWAATGAACQEDCEPSWLCRANDISTCYEEWDDDQNHGTHVAGTAAAAMNNTGVVGVAPDATLHSVKVLDCCGSGSYEDIAAGIEWATDQGHDVINMSLGGDESQVVNDACDYAAAMGVVIVAAAGNAGPCDDCVGSPADHPEVIAVSATTEDDELAEFSSTGPEVEIAAPGEDVLSSIPRDDYEEYPGTSMASPHVAGAAASVIAAGVTDREDVRDALKDGAEDIGLDDEEQGAGRLNVMQSVDDDDDDDDPPDVEIEIFTHSAEGVGETTAELHGELHDFDGTDEVEVWFEYGPIGTGFPESTDSGHFDSPSAFVSEVSGLSAGTSYEFRAHGAAEGLEENGGVQTFTTDEDDDEGGWCYITTATTRDQGTLDSLRRFRDDSMAATPLGRGMIGLYYRISPPIAKSLQRHPDGLTARACRRLIETCASLSDRQEQTDSRLESAALGVALTNLYVVGILVGAGGHAGIRTRETLNLDESDDRDPSTLATAPVEQS